VRVVAFSGEPIAGAHVFVLPSARAFTTDSTGRVTLFPESAQLHLRIDADGYSSYSNWVRADSELVIASLHAHRALELRFTNITDAWDNQQVQVAFVEAESGRCHTRSVRVAPSVVIDGPDPGCYNISIEEPEGSPIVGDGTYLRHRALDAAREPVTLRLPAGARICGSIRFASGVPFAGRLWFDTPWRSARADADGEFVSLFLPEGERQVWAVFGGCAVVVARVEVPARGTALHRDVWIRGSCTLDGTVTTVSPEPVQVTIGTARGNTHGSWRP
jgi:hypothetical protein